VFQLMSESRLYLGEDAKTKIYYRGEGKERIVVSQGVNGDTASYEKKVSGPSGKYWFPTHTSKVKVEIDGLGVTNITPI
jgi:hypothetical protein